VIEESGEDSQCNISRVYYIKLKVRVNGRCRVGMPMIDGRFVAGTVTFAGLRSTRQNRSANNRQRDLRRSISGPDCRRTPADVSVLNVCVSSNRSTQTVSVPGIAVGRICPGRSENDGRLVRLRCGRLRFLRPKGRKPAVANALAGVWSCMVKVVKWCVAGHWLSTCLAS
jgi:hypothetical protein